MSWCGLVVVDLATLALLLWVLNLVRVGRLYVGYGVLIVIVLASIGLTISFPPLTETVGETLGALFPSATAGVAALGLGFLLVMLVYVLSQLTTLANRVAALVQALAVERSRLTEDPNGDPPDATKGEPAGPE